MILVAFASCRRNDEISNSNETTASSVEAVSTEQSGAEKTAVLTEAITKTVVEESVASNGETVTVTKVVTEFVTKAQSSTSKSMTSAVTNAQTKQTGTVAETTTLSNDPYVDDIF